MNPNQTQMPAPPQMPPSPMQAGGQAPPNKQFEQLVLERFSQLSDQEAEIFAQMINPNTGAVLLKVFPELQIIIAQAQQMAGGQGQPPMPPQGAQGGGEPNPLSNPRSMNPNVSRGLVGG